MSALIPDSKKGYELYIFGLKLSWDEDKDLLKIFFCRFVPQGLFLLNIKGRN